MAIDFKEIQNDPRVANAAWQIPEAIRSYGSQLLTSGYERHLEAYGAFAELSERNKHGVCCLVVGLGNLSEVVGYVAAYYGQHKSTEGLNVDVMDFIAQEFFLDLVNQPEIFGLGKDEKGMAIYPADGQERAFTFDPINQEYFLRGELCDFVRETVSNGVFGVSVESFDQTRFSHKKYDFVSCQNVIGYIPVGLVTSPFSRRDRAIAALTGAVNDGGILAIKTDSVDRKIAESIEKQGLPLVILKDREYTSGLYQKPRKHGGRKVKGFFNWESEEGKEIVKNRKISKNVFGI